MRPLLTLLHILASCAVRGLATLSGACIVATALIAAYLLARWALT